MQRLSAWLLSLWLGVQVGVVGMVSPILLTNFQINKSLSTHLINIFLNIANVLSMIACVLAWLTCRPKMQWGRPTHSLRKWLGILLLGFGVSCLILTPAVSHYPSHFLVNWLGGELGLWRGSLHIWNIVLTLWGMGLSLRLLRLAEN